MQFDSLAYLWLLLGTTLAFFALPPRARPWVLIIATTIFYGAWSVVFLGLIGVSAMVDYACGRLMEPAEGRRRKLLLSASVITNLSILGYFKYAGFFAQNVTAIFGIEIDERIVATVLPPGISFYTFQTMSYSIDVYRRQIRPTRSFVRFLVYVGFFPQLVAGPIERAARLLPQLHAAYNQRLHLGNLAAGTQLIVWGMFKKVVLADNVARLADPVYDDPTAFGGWAALVATYAFTLQIYLDFSAYSEIARGSARLFGVTLMRNFDQPYLVTNVREFWRHWHISLSEWFRDYVYRPLGGNRAGKGRTLANLTATMFLSGLWHGAAWTFVAWGLYHGVLLLVHALADGSQWLRGVKQRLGIVWTAGALVFTFHLVVIGWVLFRARSFADAATVLSSIAGSTFGLLIGGSGPTPLQVAFFAAVAGFIGLSAWSRHGRWRDWVDASPTRSALVYAVLLAAILLLGAEDGPQFIYFQF